jgi:ADP-ribose pyrophosphatase
VVEQHWKLLGTEPVSDHRIFRLRHDRYRLETNGAEHDFIVMDSPDWVLVVPITVDGQVVLVRQYRHGVRQVSLEPPGGMIDPGEPPAEAALRELREESGYAAQRVRSLGRVSPNPALQNNWCYMFVAEGCRLDRAPQPDRLECIEVELCRPDDIAGLIAGGRICHALAINAFGFLGLQGNTGDLS